MIYKILILLLNFHECHNDYASIWLVPMAYMGYGIGTAIVCHPIKLMYIDEEWKRKVKIFLS